ncbi:MAG: molybdate ABC transporter permease subunit [Flavobacteriales bacterium]
MPDLSPLILTFKLAVITTAILFCIGIPLGKWLGKKQSKVSNVIEALISLPIILPPTVLGFYLLLAFSPNNAFGIWLQKWLGLKLVFSFEGLVVASIIYSLPFMVQPIKSGFRELPDNISEAARTLGASPLKTLFKVELPGIKQSLVTAGVLSFAHTIGEFGVVLMIGGNIPGETRVASIAVFDKVEALDYTSAHIYSMCLLLTSFIVLVLVHLFNNKKEKAVWGKSI